MSLTIDGSGATAIASGVSSVSASITTSNANDIILAFVHCDAINGTSAPTVTVSASGMTWTRRASKYVGTSAPFNTVELWWAPATSALSAKSIAATFSRAIDDCSIQLVAVNGCGDLSAPFDTNASLPATVGSASTVSTSATISTAAASTLLLGFFGTLSGTNETLGSGWTTLLSTANTGGSNFSETFSQYRNFSAAQTNFTAAFGGATRSNFGVIFDALMASAPVTGTGAASVSPSSSASGVHGVAGTASAALAPTATASGMHGVLGVASASFSPTASASGSYLAPVTGTGFASIALTGSATGAEGGAGLAAASITVSATAAGAHGVSGSAAASITLSLAGSAAHGVAGTALGAISLTGSGVGTFTHARVFEDWLNVTVEGVFDLNAHLHGVFDIASLKAGTFDTTTSLSGTIN